MYVYIAQLNNKSAISELETTLLDKTLLYYM